MNRRIGLAALFVASLGFALALVSYVRYANVWLRKPPRLPPCALVSRQGLLHEDPVTGSIPTFLEDGSTVYLRKPEDRAVRCMDRMSSPIAKSLAGAFAEIAPEARSKALVAVLRDHVPADPGADREAIAVYVFATAALRAMPDQEALAASRDELDQLNACRFSMRTPCKVRPPMPLVVYVAGAPSSLVLVAGLGFLLRGLVRSVIERWRTKALLAKARAESTRGAG